MARDRLAAMRQQNANAPSSDPAPPMRQAGGPGGYGGGGLPSNPRGRNPFSEDSGYEQPPPSYNGYNGAGGGGGGSGLAGGRGGAGGGGGGYEMSEKAKNPFGDSSTSLTGGGGGGYGMGGGGPAGGDDMTRFFDEIGSLQSSLRDLSTGIDTISSIHSRLRSIPSTTSPQHATLSDQLDSTASSTRSLSNRIKSSISSLNQETKDFASTPGKITQSDVDLRLKQIGNVQRRFVDLVQKYAQVEKEGRDYARNKLDRQVRIVNPDASESEVRQAVEDIASGNGDVFSQALSSSQRLGSARGALSEVQSRQEEIQKIERTITELAQMFTDMAVMVDEQDVQIVAIEQKADDARLDLEKGHGELKVATVSARKARKKRWICFFIFLAILIAAGVVIAIFVLKNKNKGGGDGSNSAGNEKPNGNGS